MMRFPFLTNVRPVLACGLLAGIALLMLVAGPARRIQADDKTAAAQSVAASAAETPAKTDKPPVNDKAAIEKSGNDKAAKKPAAVVLPISPERETAAIEFAQQNHPELVPILQGLKKNGRKEYQAALADLDRTADRLTKLKEKSPERYEFQLAEWKISSRIRLLAAKLAMGEDPSVESELRAALRERVELRLNAQRTERDKLQKRVEKLDQTIGELASKTDSQIETQLQELKSTMRATKAAAKGKVKRPVAAGSVDIKGGKE